MTASTPRAKRRPAPMLLTGAWLLIALVLVAILAPIFLGGGANDLSPAIRQGPSTEHGLGTDAFGRDIFARTLVATRLTMVMALASAAIAAVVGIGIGTTAALGGRRQRTVGSRVIDLLVSYPPIIVAVAIIAIFNPGKVSVAVGVGVALVPQFARLSNKLATAVLAKDYIALARHLGLSSSKLLSRHVLPNILAPLLVLLSVVFATSIVALSGLSFIGLGVQPPAYDWGQLLAAGLRDVNEAPWAAVGPAGAILLTGLAAGLLGDGFDAYLAPRETAGAKRRRSHRPADVASPVDAGAAPTPADDHPAGPAPLVNLRNLTISAGDEDSLLRLIRGVDLVIRPAECVGVVGESGSGKSLTAMSLARLLPDQLKWNTDGLTVCDSDLSDPTRPAPTSLATNIGVVFQDPSACFNPAMRLGAQLTEVIRVHRGVSKRDAYQEALTKLREVQISNPEQRMRQYPHELSGGMRQRAMIAMALLAEPKLLVADEPTTALDVTVQAEVLRLMKRLSETHDMAMLLISHDINVVSTMADRAYVMYAGRIVEEISSAQLRVGNVRHPYTQALLGAALDSHVDVNTPLAALPGRPPRPNESLTGCSFAPRCPLRVDICTVLEPVLTPAGDGRAACHVNAPSETLEASR